MKKALLTILVSVTAIAGLFTWIFYSEKELDYREILMIGGAALVVGFGLFISIRRIKDAKNNLPVEDELSKKIMKNTGATAYYFSLYLWLLIMLFEERITLERSTLIGIGILGMAIIFAASWVYHNYFGKKHD